MQVDSGNDLEKKEIKLSHKEVSQIVAALFLGVFFIFIGGYFLGKKKMLEELNTQQQEAGFAQKVYNSLVAINASSEGVLGSEGLDEGSGKTEILEVSDSSLPEAQEVQAEIKSDPIKHPAAQREAAYAQLSGFGKKVAAQAYLDSLNRRGIDAILVERTSKTQKGKTITWYQVVTGTMEKSELILLVEKIKKTDKLTDVKIIDIQTS